jgi:fatty acid desaturase
MAKRINTAEFRKRADYTSCAIVVSHVMLTLGPAFLAAWIGPSPWWVALWLCMGLLMNGLLNLMHECAHYHVFQKRRGSDLLGRWLLGPLLLADFDGYRERHWKHHIHLGVDGDTKDAYLVDIRGARLAQLLLKCLTLQTAAEKFRTQLGGKKPAAGRSLPWIIRTALGQAVLLGLLVLVAGPIRGQALWPHGILVGSLGYILVYLYGLASLTVCAATLRAIAEHQIEVGQNSTTGRAALRNFDCGPLAWLVFGAYGFAQHATHHREPALPYYNLPEATAYLAAEDIEFSPSHKYLTEIITLARGGAAKPCRIDQPTETPPGATGPKSASLTVPSAGDPERTEGSKHG